MNITQAQILALNVRAMAVQAEIAACQVHDRHQEAIHESQFYTEETYVNLSNELHRIAEEIQTLARSGGLS